MHGFLAAEVWVLRQGQGPRIKVTAAELVFVALDDNGRPRPVGRATTIADDDQPLTAPLISEPKSSQRSPVKRPI